MAAPAPKNYNFPNDGTPIKVVLPAPNPNDGTGSVSPYGTTAETVNSAPFTWPRGGIGVSIHVPTLAGGGDTVKLQSQETPDNDQVAPTFRDVKVFNLADGTFTAVAALASNTCTTLPIAALGGGTFRWVASADQSAAPVTIRMNMLVTR